VEYWKNFCKGYCSEPDETERLTKRFKIAGYDIIEIEVGHASYGCESCPETLSEEAYLIDCE
jgi:hypothetical protein